MEDVLDVLHAAWTAPVVTYDGPPCRIAPCTIEPKPVQGPRPPVMRAAFTPAGLDRIARRAGGWLPVGLPHEVLASMWAALRDLAAGHGRDPDRLELVVRGNVEVTAAPIDGDRPVFVGNLDQVVADVVATQALGAHGLVLDLYANAATAAEELELADAITRGAGIALPAATAGSDGAPAAHPVAA